MAFKNQNARPAGYSSDSEDEDGDFYTSLSKRGDNMDVSSDDDFGFRGKERSTTGESLAAGTGMAPPQKKLQQEISRSSSSSSTSSSFGVPSKGRGRGRGRGQLYQDDQCSYNVLRGNWGGRGRSGAAAGLNGATGRCRRRSSSPGLTGVDKRRMKETLIKRVPDFGTGVKQEAWAREVVKNLKGVWDADQKQVKSENKKFTEELRKAFQICHKEKGWNVPCLAILFVMTSSDYLAIQGGKNHAQAVCTGLDEYIKSFLSSSKEDPLLAFSHDLQKLAFEAAIFQRKESLLKHMLTSFQLCDSASNPSLEAYLLQEIHKLLDGKEYTEACQCATHLQLHAHFDIHSFLVPLILQDKPSLVEEFLQGSVSHQKNFIMFLDEQFQYGPVAVFNQLLQYRRDHGVPNTKEDKFNHKPISKLIKRLKTKYNLGFECCPNIGHRQRYGELRHIFSRRYEKDEMNADSFAELVEQLSQDPGLREDIVSHYLDYLDYENASKFIIVHKLYSSSACQHPQITRLLPDPWKSQWEEKCRVGSPEDDCWDDDGNSDVPITKQVPPQEKLVEEDWEGEGDIEGEGLQQEPVKKAKMKPCFSHPFPACSVAILTKPEEVFRLCEVLARGDIPGAQKSSGGPVVSGFDSEWKPIMSRTAGAALLQLAFETEIYLVDVVSIKEYLSDQRSMMPASSNKEQPCPWKALRQHYFENELLLKLGFDLRNDVKMLTETVPQWKGLSSSWRRMLDLSSLRSLILKACPHLFSQKDGTAPKSDGESGLSELVLLCTGKCLSKEEQMSDWEKRPLRDSQVMYAASDAYCLISVYRKLETLCQKKKVDLPRIVAKYFKGLASNNSAGGNNGEVAPRKKRGSVEMVLELIRQVPPPGVDKKDTGCVKLVVDTMLLGLVRYLRSLGFDTKMVDCNQGHDNYIKYVAIEKRVVITRGLTAYNRIMRELDGTGVTGEMVYNVKSETTPDQLEEICNHFGVSLNPSRLFIICFRCNSSDFIKASLKLMYSLMEIAGCHLPKKPQGNPHPSSTQVPDNENLVDESVNLLKIKGFDDMILFVSPTDETHKKWSLLDEETLRLVEGGRLVLTNTGERVELTRLQLTYSIMDQVFICNGCGKCYWSSQKLEALYRQNV